MIKMIWTLVFKIFLCFCNPKTSVSANQSAKIKENEMTWPISDRKTLALENWNTKTTDQTFLRSFFFLIGYNLHYKNDRFILDSAKEKSRDKRR